MRGEDEPYTRFRQEAFGNAQSFESIDECWFEERLGVDVLRRRSDPRSGDQVTEIINLTRS